MLRIEAKEKIDAFFQRENFSSEEMRKIKRLAMKYRIRLTEYRNMFCKQCHSQLKGKTRITPAHKVTVCMVCGMKNKQRIRFK